LRSWFPLDEVDLGGSQRVDREGAQLAIVLRAVTAAKPTASASANLIMRQERASDFDALHPVAISNAGDDQSALLNQLRERALASVDDLNTTLAIFEWSADDGCAVDDWGAIAQGTPGLGYTISHEAIFSSLAMDPPPGVQDLGDVPERPVARRTRCRKPVRLECV
jgi:hypothetical protein